MLQSDLGHAPAQRRREAQGPTPERRHGESERPQPLNDLDVEALSPMIGRVPKVADALIGPVDQCDVGWHAGAPDLVEASRAAPLAHSTLTVANYRRRRIVLTTPDRPA